MNNNNNHSEDPDYNDKEFNTKTSVNQDTNSNNVTITDTHNNNNDDNSKNLEEKLILENEQIPKNTIKSQESDDSNVETREHNRSLANRIFGKMEEGSMRGSIFILTNVALGIALLSIPNSFRVLGIIPGTIFIIVFSYMSYQTVKQLGRICKAYKIYDFSELIKEILGKWVQLAFDIATIIFLYGIMISGQVVSAKLLGIIVFDCGYTKDPRFSHGSGADFARDPQIWYQTWFRYVLNYIIAFVSFFPFCIPRDLAKIALISIIGIFALFYAILLVCIQFPWFYTYYNKYTWDENNPQTWVNWYNIDRGFDKYFEFFAAVTNLIYLFGFQYGALPVYKSLKNNDYRRIRKVAMRSTVLITIVIWLTCIFGYLTAPYDSPELIIYRSSKGVLNNDWMMIVGKIGVLIAVIFSYPTIYTGFRISMFQLILRRVEYSNTE